jgi:8-oxo-dGTP diphosphatase
MKDEDSVTKSVVTGVLVKNAEGKLLLVKKAGNRGPYGGTYLTPGGGVNDGEPVDDAALRELYEETGVKVRNLQRAWFDDDVTEDWQGVKRHFICLIYTAEYVSGDLNPTEGNDDEFESVGWFSSQELHTIPLAPPLMEFLKLHGELADASVEN